MPEDTQLRFRKNFLWGASTASHQIEGGNHNDWTVWELQVASQQAKTAEKRLGWLPAWESIKKQAQDPINYISGRGTDHYNRYKEDFDLLKKLNLNSLRFGIEWSRIEPEEGHWDEAAITHYHEYIRELKRRDIEPVLNLWHWTFPTWFADKGGFKNNSNLRYFERFVKRVAKEYGDTVKYVITINEPNVYASFCYQTGEWPPQERNPFTFLHVYWNLVRLHRRAYKILKKANPKLQVGVAQQLANIQAKRPHNLFDEISTKWMRYFWNWWFLRRIRKSQDFVGVNYYFSDYYTGLIKKRNPKFPLNDLGWYMEPEGLYPLLLRTWVRYKKPILITENGLADSSDGNRQWWIEETIIAIEKAVSEGVDVRGYFHWSLLDNFEWAYGWWPKFGLIAVDREHGMKRTIRPSAEWFAQRIDKLTK
jgi:beta-glucosidase